MTKKKRTPRKSTRIKRLEQLEHMLLNHKSLFKEIEFDMNYWQENKEGVTSRQSKANPRKCATAACALGSACLYKPFINQGLKAKEYDGDINPYFEDDEGYNAGASFFDISWSESTELFDPGEYSKPKVTAKDVAKRVRTLIDRYTFVEDFEKNVLPEIKKFEAAWLIQDMLAVLQI